MGTVYILEKFFIIGPIFMKLKLFIIGPIFMKLKLFIIGPIFLYYWSDLYETFYFWQFFDFRSSLFYFFSKRNAIFRKYKDFSILKVESWGLFYDIIKTFIQHVIFSEFWFLLLFSRFFFLNPKLTQVKSSLFSTPTPKNEIKIKKSGGNNVVA